MRATEPWHRLSKEVVESPSMEILKSHLGTVPGSWLWLALMVQGTDKVSSGDASNLKHPVIL